MDLKIQIIMVLMVSMVVAIALEWIKADLEAWGDTVIVFDDDEAERYVIVKENDSFWAIARREYGGSETGRWVYEICQLNPGIDPGRLQIGQKVRVP